MNTSYGITSKNQVTLPKEIRGKLGLTEHDRIQFETKNGEVVIKKARSLAVLQEQLHTQLVKRGVGKASDDEIRQARDSFYKNKLKW